MNIQCIYIDGSDVYLTISEVSCLAHFSQGKTTEEIAKHVQITPRTVKAHIRNIKDKLNLDNQFQLGMIYAKIQSLTSSHF